MLTMLRKLRILPQTSTSAEVPLGTSIPGTSATSGPMLMEELEPRILHSADLTPIFDANDSLALQPEHHRVEPYIATVEPVSLAEQQTRSMELVFVDTATPDYQALLDDLTGTSGVQRNFEIVLIDHATGGVDIISETLKGRDGVDAIHIISHGSDGAVQIGQDMLNLQSLSTYESQLQGWSSALTTDADLLIYGCSVAETANGRALVDALARVTGADVAGSDDLTGAAVLGGDWELEYATGVIEIPVALTQIVQGEWSGTLAVANVAASQDTYIDTGNNTSNYGASTTLAIDAIGSGLGSQRILVQFDLSSIPVGATINDAKLQLQATTISGSINLDVYEVTQSWVEGNQIGTPGAANWDQRAPATNWTTAGGTIGSTAEATLNTTATGLHAWTLTSLVQAWVDVPASNNGALLASPDSGGATVTYDSRELGATGPRLVIDYTAALAVDTTNDVLDGDTSSVAALLASKGTDGKISLREAIIAANNTTGADTISLGAGNYALSRTGAGENAAVTGDLDITDTLTITGAGADTTFVDGGGLDRVFQLLGSSATISGVTVGNGSATNGGGIMIDGSSSLTLIDAAVSGNTASAPGGGILVSGTLTLDRVTIEGNSADVGGGIYVGNGASATITNATLSGNTAASDGGAISTRGAVIITNSTIASNFAGVAGGINMQGVGSATLQNTILANNTSGNASGALTSLGNNIDSANTAALAGPGDQINTDPLLGLLQYNGGTLKTMALLTGSPAIDAGSAAGLPLPPTVDQRGFVRDASPDIGAYELITNSAAVGVPTISGTVTEDQVLTADTTGISDADGLGAFSYQWLRNGGVIGGATASTYTLGDADVGTQISVQVSYTDVQGAAEGPLTSAQTAAVTGVNDAPSLTTPISIAINVDVASAITAISFSDVDAAGASVVATFAVAQGTLAAVSGGGVTVGGSATALTLTGSITNINAFIAASNLTYTTALNDNSAVTLGVSVNDQGNTGSGGALSSAVSNVTLNSSTITLSANLVAENSANGTGIGFASVSAPNIVGDGQFLNAGTPLSFTTYNSGQTFGGWTVTQASVDLLGTSFDPSPLGGNAIDLAGGLPGFGGPGGTISQTLSTVAGQQYQVTFELSGAWFIDSNVKNVRVSFDGTSQDIAISMPAGWNSATDMMWAQQTLAFTAASTSTVLSFASLDGNGAGPIVADVSVVPVPASYTFALTNDAGGRFTINATSGQVTVANGSLLDYETATSHNIAVRASIGATPVADQGFTIQVTNVNDAPTLTAPVAIGVTEDLASAITGISFADVDAAGASVIATFTVAQGTLAASSGGGVIVGGTATTLTLTGSIANINAFVSASSLTYTTVLNDTSAVNLAVSVNDLGNTGGAALSSPVSNVTLNVTAVNDVPMVTSAALTLNEGQTVTLAAANFGITDPDNASFTYTVSAVSGGYFQLTSAVGTPITTFSSADLSGTLVQFVDDDNEVAPSFSVTVNDGLIDSNTLAATINYTPVNDAPSLTAPGAIGVTEDLASAITGISFADVDAAGASVVATFTVAQGTLAASSGGGVIVGGTATTLTLTGSIANINAFISASSLSYTTVLNDTSAVNLAVSVNDQGNTGGGALSSPVSNVTLNVSAVTNPPPAPPIIPPTLSGPPPAPEPPSPPEPPVIAETPSEPESSEATPAGSGGTPVTVDALFAPETSDLAASTPAPTGSAFTADTHSGNTTRIAAAGTGFDLRYFAFGGADLSSADYAFALMPSFALPTFGAGMGALEAPAFNDELDRLQDSLEEQTQSAGTVITTGTIASLGLSVGYVMWLLRAEVLLGSLLSTMPAWRLVDPLPVIGRLADDDEDDDGDDDSLETMVERENRENHARLGTEVIAESS